MQSEEVSDQVRLSRAGKTALGRRHDEEKQGTKRPKVPGEQGVFARQHKMQEGDRPQSEMETEQSPNPAYDSGHILSLNVLQNAAGEFPRGPSTQECRENGRRGCQGNPMAFAAK